MPQFKCKKTPCRFYHDPLEMSSSLPKHAVTYQYGPSGFVIVVAHASRFGLLHSITLDPAPQLMG